jgi:D-3-phosphoglycerate dehydrogenase
MSYKYYVVVTENRFKEYPIEEKVLQSCGAVLEIRDCITKQEIMEATSEAHAVLVNLQKYDADIINNMKNCRIIARYGIGYDNVDLEAAKQKGIWVTNVPDYGAEVSVSEHAVALLLSCVRKIPYINTEIKEGSWDVQGFKPIHTIRGKTLGIIGFGKIGKEVVRKMSTFSLGKILIYDPYFSGDYKDFEYCEFVQNLSELTEKSDFISIHTPLDETTRGMISKKQIDGMKEGVILINTARGGIIDENALIEGLSGGKIGGAALDTFESEPISSDSMLRRMPMVVLTNHIGFYSVETIRTLQENAVLNVCKVLQGEKPVNPVFKV